MKSSTKLFAATTILFLVLALAPAYAASDSYDVVIARGDIPVDLIVAQSYTAKSNVPLVTITKTGLIDELRTELEGYNEQGYKKVLIIGGENAIPMTLDSELADIGYDVTRIWDWNRYGTAARVAMNLWKEADTVIVTQGDQKGELMLAARTALEYESPLLLTEKGKLPGQTKTAIETLGATRIILIGNASEEVKAELSELGGLQQTNIRPILREEPEDKKTFFVMGLVIGALVIFLLSSLWGATMLRKKNEIPIDILQADERAIINEIGKAGGKLKQQILPKLTGFSRPKVSREVTELIGRGIIERNREGKTYVLKMKKRINK